MNERTIQQWIEMFKDEDLNDRKLSGRPSTIKEDEIAKLIQQNSRCTTKEIPNILEVLHKSVALYYIYVSLA